MNKDCRHCVHVSEDIAGGTNQLFCNNPDVEYPREELDPTIAEVCDYYEQDQDPGLYFHEVPPLTNNYSDFDPKSKRRYCSRCQQYSVIWGEFDEVWYCNNCDDF
jgi:hypothetical protein